MVLSRGGHHLACPVCGAPRESIVHFALECPGLEQARSPLWSHVRRLLGPYPVLTRAFESPYLKPVGNKKVLQLEGISIWPIDQRAAQMAILLDAGPHAWPKCRRPPSHVSHPLPIGRALDEVPDEVRRELHHSVTSVWANMWGVRLSLLPLSSEIRGGMFGNNMHRFTRSLLERPSYQEVERGHKAGI